MPFSRKKVRGKSNKFKKYINCKSLRDNNRQLAVTMLKIFGDLLSYLSKEKKNILWEEHTNEE